MHIAENRQDRVEWSRKERESLIGALRRVWARGEGLTSNHFLQHGARIAAWTFRMCLLRARSCQRRAALPIESIERSPHPRRSQPAVSPSLRFLSAEISISFGRPPRLFSDHDDYSEIASDAVLVESARFRRSDSHRLEILQSRRWAAPTGGIGVEHPHHSSCRL